MDEFTKIREELNDNSFNLEHETKMVQSRILSAILDEADNQGLTNTELFTRSGISEDKQTKLFKLDRGLTMHDIALLQRGLGVVLQVPDVLTEKEHKSKFYIRTEEPHIEFEGKDF